jgi:hypothetical protein
METALRRLEKTIGTGRLKDRNKIQARHPSVHDLCAISLRDTAEGARLQEVV